MNEHLTRGAKSNKPSGAWTNECTSTQLVDAPVSVVTAARLLKTTAKTIFYLIHEDFFKLTNSKPGCKTWVHPEDLNEYFALYGYNPPKRPRAPNYNKGPSFKYSIEALKLYAKDKGGECLSQTYDGSDSYYQWKCSEGHVWSQRWGNINAGTWCKPCNYKNRRRSFAKFNGACKAKFK